MDLKKDRRPEPNKNLGRLGNLQEGKTATLYEGIQSGQRKLIRSSSRRRKGIDGKKIIVPSRKGLAGGDPLVGATRMRKI